MTLHGCDVSNWTSHLSSAHVACMKAQGVQHVVVRASLETQAKGAINLQQIDQLAAAGIDTSVYLWVYPSWSPEGTVQATVNLLAGRPCRWFWLDAEETEDLATPAQNTAWLQRAIAEIERQGKQPGIYSGLWWWTDPRYMNNSTAFKHIPLWTAEYDKNPDITRWTRYGGWTDLHGKQFEGSGSASVCGLAVDLNTFVDAVGAPEPGPEPPPPPPLAAGLPIAEVRQWLQDDIGNLKLRVELREQRLRELEKA